MLPGFALAMAPEKAARHVFHALRPGWVDDVRTGDVIVGGRAFGIGSSRPAPLLFRLLGISCLIAEEFNSLFFRNSINLGLPAVTVRDARALFAEGDLAEVDLDSGSVRNERTRATAQCERFPNFILELLDAGGVMAQLRRDGYLRGPGGSAHVTEKGAT
jgi:3-isopropylmalate/(R)-2-methylmalate dehydratase small subunit